VRGLGLSLAKLRELRVHAVEFGGERVDGGALLLLLVDLLRLYSALPMLLGGDGVELDAQVRPVVAAW